MHCVISGCVKAQKVTTGGLSPSAIIANPSAFKIRTANNRLAIDFLYDCLLIQKSLTLRKALATGMYPTSRWVNKKMDILHLSCTNSSFLHNKCICQRYNEYSQSVNAILCCPGFCIVVMLVTAQTIICVDCFFTGNMKVCDNRV